MMQRLAWLLALTFAQPWAWAADEAVRNLGVVLLQPSEVIEKRVDGVDAVADYLGKVQQAAAGALAAQFQHKPTGGFIVVAVRPSGQTRVWLDLEPDLHESVQAPVRRAVAAVPALAVRDGVVVLAVKVSIWGGAATPRFAPAPKEWKAVAAQAGKQLEVAELVERSWGE